MNKSLLTLLLTLYICIGPASLAQAEPEAEQVLVGWVEKVSVNDHDFALHAKIDSGADNTSINTVNPEYYEKDGQRWVKFKVTNDEGKTLVIDKPIVRTTKIKTKDGGRQKRDVIELDLCLGKIKKTVRVSLVDRSHFKYQLLVGRSYLRPEFLIDSGRRYLVEPDCGKN